MIDKKLKEFREQWYNNFLDDKYMHKHDLGERVELFIKEALEEVQGELCHICKHPINSIGSKVCSAVHLISRKHFEEQESKYLLEKGVMEIRLNVSIKQFEEQEKRLNEYAQGRYDQGCLDTCGFKMASEEELAEYAHNTWSGWIKYMFSKMERQTNGDWWIPKWAYERWTRQANTAYKDLPEDEKESDRKEARTIIALSDKVTDDDFCDDCKKYHKGNCVDLI